MSMFMFYITDEPNAGKKVQRYSRFTNLYNINNSPRISDFNKIETRQNGKEYLPTCLKETALSIFSCKNRRAGVVYSCCSTGYSIANPAVYVSHIYVCIIEVILPFGNVNM